MLPEAAPLLRQRAFVVFLVSHLLNNGVNVNVYDPYVNKYDFENELDMYDGSELQNGEGNEKRLHFFDDPFKCIDQATCLVFCNNHYKQD